MFYKISSSGPFELKSVCISCIPASISVFLEAWYYIQNKQKQRKQKINGILSQVERERPWKKGKSYIFMSPMALSSPAFSAFTDSCKFHSLPCVETGQNIWGGSCEIMNKSGVRSGLRQRCLGLRWKRFWFIFDRGIYPSKFTYTYICAYT